MTHILDKLGREQPHRGGHDRGPRRPDRRGPGPDATRRGLRGGPAAPSAAVLVPRRRRRTFAVKIWTGMPSSSGVPTLISLTSSLPSVTSSTNCLSVPFLSLRYLAWTSWTSASYPSRAGPGRRVGRLVVVLVAVSPVDPEVELATELHVVAARGAEIEAVALEDVEHPDQRARLVRRTDRDVLAVVVVDAHGPALVRLGLDLEMHPEPPLTLRVAMERTWYDPGVRDSSPGSSPTPSSCAGRPEQEPAQVTDAEPISRLLVHDRAAIPDQTVAPGLVLEVLLMTAWPAGTWSPGDPSRSSLDAPPNGCRRCHPRWPRSAAVAIRHGPDASTRPDPQSRDGFHASLP